MVQVELTSGERLYCERVKPEYFVKKYHLVNNPLRSFGSCLTGVNREATTILPRYQGDISANATEEGSGNQ